MAGMYVHLLHEHTVFYALQYIKSAHNPSTTDNSGIPFAQHCTSIIMVLYTIQVYKCNIDFFPESYELLKLKEERGTYPPRFRVVISCIPTARQSQSRIEFKGAINDPMFDVPLNLLSAIPTSPSVASSGN